MTEISMIANALPDGAVFVSVGSPEPAFSMKISIAAAQQIAAHLIKASAEAGLVMRGLALDQAAAGKPN